MFKKWRSTQIVQIKYIWEIGVVPILQCNCYYTLIFINFVILLLLFTSLRDFNPIQRDFFPLLWSLTRDNKMHMFEKNEGQPK